MNTESSSSVSIVIASHRSDYISRCLAALGECVVDAIPVEIIVIADYPVDSYMQNYPDIAWYYLPDRSISAKRNKGIDCAKSSIIGFLDDDCRPDRNWIREAVTFLEKHPDISGVEGLTLIDIPEKQQPSYRQFKRLEKQGYRTNNMFYRRAALIEAGRFDERFTVQREDIDLAFTILESGEKISYNETQKAMHAYRANEKWDLLKNCINRRFDPLLYKKHQRLYRTYIRSPFTPTIALLLAAYAVSIPMCFIIPQQIITIAGTNILIVLIATARRAAIGKTSPAQWMRELIACAVSPAVLLLALVWGNMRFKAFLII